jgi:arylformamidase
MTSSHSDKDKGYGLDHLRAEVNYRPRWGEVSAAWRQTVSCQCDVSYGVGDRGFLDFFPAANAATAPTLVFIHGGYWHKGDKSFYSFVAQPFVERGVSCITLNYDFCPSVHITDITAQVQQALVWIWRHADELRIDGNRLHLSGHSAGGHLTAMMATTRWSDVAPDLPSDLIKSAIPVSGLFNLAPLLVEPVNEVLRLTKQEAQDQSPLGRVANTRVPHLVGSGGYESDAFNGQSDAYATALQQAGVVVERLQAPQCNHFEVMDAYADPQSELFQKMLALIQRS